MVIIKNVAEANPIYLKIKEAFGYPGRLCKSTKEMFILIDEIIEEITNDPEFECYDTLALKSLIRDNINEYIDKIINEKIEKKNINYNDLDITAKSTRRIDDEIFWGSGYLSWLKGEVVLARINQALHYGPNQQPYSFLAESEEELKSMDEYMEKIDKQNATYAFNAINDFANAVLGKDVKLVKSKTREKSYKKQYKELSCSKCPYSLGFKEFSKNRRAVGCSFVPWPVSLYHPAGCTQIKNIGDEEKFTQKMLEEYGPKKTNKYTNKRAKIEQKYGPLKLEETPQNEND